MKSLDELPTQDKAPSAASQWCEQTAKRIQKKPYQAIVQAALAGYALRFLPVRRILSGAMRLVVPGIFLAGLYQISKSLPVVQPDSIKE